MPTAAACISWFIARGAVLVFPLHAAWQAARVLRAAPAHVASPQALPAFPFQLTYGSLYVGAASRAFEYSEAQVKTQYLNPANTAVLWYPAAAPLRKTERFKTLMRDAGYVDFWRTRGWPDLCHPVGADDFACN